MLCIVVDLLVGVVVVIGVVVVVEVVVVKGVVVGVVVVVVGGVVVVVVLAVTTVDCILKGEVLEFSEFSRQSCCRREVCKFD